MVHHSKGFKSKARSLPQHFFFFFQKQHTFKDGNEVGKTTISSEQARHPHDGALDF